MGSLSRCGILGRHAGGNIGYVNFAHEIHTYHACKIYMHIHVNEAEVSIIYSPVKDGGSYIWGIYVFDPCIKTQLLISHIVPIPEQHDVKINK